MSTGADLLILAALGWLVWVVLFGKAKPSWHPFGGLIKHDRKTGAVTVTLTLPGKSKRKRRKR